jgi:hypothetical protein
VGPSPTLRRDVDDVEPSAPPQPGARPGDLELTARARKRAPNPDTTRRPGSAEAFFHAITTRSIAMDPALVLRGFILGFTIAAAVGPDLAAR